MISAKDAQAMVKRRQAKAAEELRRALGHEISAAANQGKRYISMDTMGVDKGDLSELKKELEGLGYEVVKSYSTLLVKW